MASKKILLEDMTRPQIETAIENGRDTVILMAGAIEQHGPHLPVSTDTVLGYEWGTALANELGNALVAPVIRPALSEHHMDFAGTISLREETFELVLEDYIRSLVKTGFRNIAIICSHGGNIPGVKDALPQLKENYSSEDVSIEAILNLKEKDKELIEYLKTKGVTEDQAGTHSGFTETSCMLDLAGNLVDEDRMEGGFTGDVESDELHEKGLAAFTENGILGDARDSTGEIGSELNRMTVQFYAREIRSRLESS